MKQSKRFFDVIFSSAGMIALMPLFVLAAVMIKLEDGGPVFFRQVRVGRHGRPFLLWKFRTMVTDAEKAGMQITVGTDPRVTRVGWWLRKLKIDELPQLINVIAGHMSLVGPRPEVPQYVKLYDREQMKVLEMVPGITDPASICYIDESELLARSKNPEKVYAKQIMPDKIRINMEYAQGASVISDFTVILKTLVKIAR